MQKKILVIDDDPSLVALLYHSLTEQGYEVYKAHDGQEGLQQIYNHQPDLIILDIIMPELDGWQVCRRTREMSDVPIIMLTARGKEEDIVRGLDCGADDYLSKPFSVTELLARVRAVLRRAALPPPTEGPITYSDGYLTVNLTERRVVVRGEPVKLTPTEFRLLAQLVEHAGRALTYSQLLEKVWGWEYKDDIDYVRIYIWHLRQRIEKDPSQPQYILTEYGVGYRFDSSITPSP
jgi:two-component system KDP operon response regulator KdpE